MRRTRSFTLIELIIVIAVLGILISLILPRFSDIRREVHTTTCVANLRALASSMAVYEARHGREIDWDGSETGNPITCADLVDWGYITTEPKEPYGDLGKGDTYELKDGSPDFAECPNQYWYKDHVWPPEEE